METIDLNCIVGPTAIGKSKIAVEVAGMINGEIVSADSMQVYKYFNIGTAKLTENEKYTSRGQYINHYLIDIVKPDNSFNVYEFQHQAFQVFRKIQEKGKKIIMVGGTGFYINSVINYQDYFFQKSPPDLTLRQKMYNKLKKHGSYPLYKKLTAVNPDAAAKIHPHDWRRIIRYLEITLQNNNNCKSLKNITPQLKVRGFHLFTDRSILYKLINERVEKMIQEGLIDEVRKLLKSYSPNCLPLQSLGYRHVLYFLKGYVNMAELLMLMKRDTRRYAKKQITWFKRYQNFHRIRITSQIRDTARQIAALIEQDN